MEAIAAGVCAALASTAPARAEQHDNAANAAEAVALEDEDLTLEDYALLLFLIGLVVYLARSFMRRRSEARLRDAMSRARLEAMRSQQREEDDSTGVRLHIFFGSQTGTAEGFSKDIAELAKQFGFVSRVVDLEDFDADALLNATESKPFFAIFVVATYGEGDPSDNAIEFHRWLKNEADELGAGSLRHVHYSVFGLGNRQYEHYNAMGKFANTNLAKFGAQTVYAYGEGDDDGTLEEDFEEWKESLLPAFHRVAFPEAEDINLSAHNPSNMAPTYKFQAIVVPQPKWSPAELAEEGRFDTRTAAKHHQAPHGKLDLSSKHYFQAVRVPVQNVHELRQGPGGDGLGSTLHAEFDLGGTQLSYRTAENMAILPENDPQDVEECARLLGFDLNEWFELRPSDDSSELGPLFPTPCTVRTALACYCSINSMPTAGVLNRLAHFAGDAAHREQLFHMASKEGKETRVRFIQEERRSVLDVLRAFPSIQPDLAHFFEACPRLQPRYYTIASSNKVHPSRVQLILSVVRERLPGGDGNRMFKGVCTNQIARMLGSSGTASIFFRDSDFKLPRDPAVPLVMCGPGTGLAPMRAFVQERQWQKAQGKITGETVLFFGCRRRDEDFICEQELLQACQNGALTSLHTAFSREQAHKVYVQDMIREHASQVWDLLSKKKGHFYVCGGTQMGKDVSQAMEYVAVKAGGMMPGTGHEWVAQLQKEGRYVQELWS